MSNSNAILRTMVRGAYDIQKLRIQMGNRIVGNFKAKLGQDPGETEEESLDKKGREILEMLRAQYKKITDGVKVFPRHATFVGDEIISNYTELCLLAQYVDLETEEARHFSRLDHILTDYPIYTKYLEHIKGIGPAMAGVIMTEIDIAKARYPSSLWKYAGLDVAGDGAGRSRRKEHLVEREYKDRKGKMQTRQGITFNPFLKTKLTGVLAASFLRACNERYSKIYYDYRTRLENHAVYSQETKGRRHNMSLRYMVKIFLIDLYVFWRELEGLEVAPTYHEAKLGHKHDDRPSNWSHPLANSAPSQPRPPRYISESDGKSHPSQASEPFDVSHSCPISEPHARSQPRSPSEPRVKRQPKLVSAPDAGRPPKKKSEPHAKRPPSSRSAPVQGRAPKTISVPFAQRPPLRTSAPQDSSPPQKISAPSTASRPSKASDRARDDKPPAAI